MLPQPVCLGKYFHDAFRVHPDNMKKRMEWKKLKKKRAKSRYSQRNRTEIIYDNDCQSPPEMELPGNPSAFAVFASIRLTVLDRWMRQASQTYLQSSCSAPNLLQDQSEIESDSDDNSQSSTYMQMKVSKVVGLGLRAVFELIKESRVTHPALCTKALRALLDVLQGQTPEGLRHESLDVIDQLFELLLDLACMHGPESSVPNDGTHLTAIACACLLSLVVVRGETGKYLAATAALLMCPRALSLQNIQMPIVLSSLQRSVQGVLLGKVVRPDWITHGIPSKSKITCFKFKLPFELQNATVTFKSLASDGHYLYLYTSHGLFKIGSGFGGTLSGHIFFWKQDFYSSDKGNLIVSAGNLYLKLEGRRGCEFLIVERNNLIISGAVSLHSRDEASAGIFSDGDNIGTISPSRDGGFVVRLLNQHTNPASLMNELPLKLARKCVDVFGTAPFEEEGTSQSSNIESEEEIASICTGKEFGLMRTVTGKVLYSGKASALGIKQAGVRTGKWSELALSKIPKITFITMGHDGNHAVMLAEDGSAFFTGTARRGEDGDPSKIRRQPKPMKPKKMIKVDGQMILFAACNNGTTALVTRDGELLVFGKDITHADLTTGLVHGLKGEFIVQVALGKAHSVALSNKGHVFTFGINNKYQCGRDYVFASKEAFAANIVAMETCSAPDENDIIEEGDENVKESDNTIGSSDSNAVSSSHPNICPAGMHSWHDNMCMICTVCRECTGYSISCLSSMSSERNPGQECGCGEGDSGCSICGCCRICAREVVDNSELADLAGMMKLDMILRDKVLVPQRHRSKLQDHQLQNGVEERKNRGRKSIAGPSKHTAKVKSVRPVSSTNATHQSSNMFRQSNLLGTEQGSDVERDATRIACLPPAKIMIPSESPVCQIACGLHHSVLLLQNGQVYAFGSNVYGQLGSGDILVKNTIQHVKLSGIAVQIAAGSNHTVLLTNKGEVYTFGNYQKGQLGRNPSSSSPQDSSQPSQSCSSRCLGQRSPWYAIPTAIPTIGPKQGRKATWIGASGDQTFVKIDESLISAVSISKSIVTANKTSIALLPTHEDNVNKFKSLIINKKDGNCSAFKGPDQLDFVNKLACLDPIYNVMWTLNVSNHEVTCYNIIASELQTKKSDNAFDNKSLFKMNDDEMTETTGSDLNLGVVLSPELALPVATNCYVTRFQAALNLLCCLDILTAAYDLNMAAVKEELDERQLVAGKQYSKEDFQGVNRFENHGGGWGYSGHSIEAIRFMADTDILLGGFGLFGGRGEYTAKMKLLDIGPEGGEQEGDGELLAETEEVAYECGPRQKYPLLFDEPVPLQAHRWYVAWCRISGPSSDCGSSGQAMVTTEDQVMFYFKSSKKSNNGTDVNAGQIPQLLYKIITPENQAPARQSDAIEPVQVLTKDFSRSVNKECFQSILSLLQWSWNTFKWGVIEGSSIKNMYTNLELERLVYISRASLRLIRTYTNEIYPNQITKKMSIENVHLAQSIGDVRGLLKQILSDNLPTILTMDSNETKNKYNIQLINSILQECHNTFVSCFHAFYPTSYLKWTCLCDLLSNVNKEAHTIQRLLSAVLYALSAPSVRLRSTFPLLGNINTPDCSLTRGLSPADNCGMPMMGISDSHYYPILVEQMSYKTQMDSYVEQLCQWDDVLKSLLRIVSDPINHALDNKKTYTLPSLTRNCCHLLARIVAELVHQCSSSDDDYQNACGRILHMTTSRFTRTNQSRSWNTGNGSPDAICFQVDRPGISIAGVGVYGGIGHYEYELELLEDQSSVNGTESHTHTQRWNSLEITRGSFVPEDYAPDIIEIKFDHPVPIKENVKYAIRLRNHGGRTNNGDGGLNSVKGSDNTTFTFSTCSLSFNGTTLTRGQIPVVMYYSNPVEYGRTSATKLEQQSRKAALNMASTIIKSTCKLMKRARDRAEEFQTAELLSNSHLVTTLLPLILAHISPLATSDPRSAVHILTLIQELLPHVAALNLMYIPTSSYSKSLVLSNSLQDSSDFKVNTTSNHYTWVEGDHPYKPATVSNYRVTFPESVQWMTIEFDPSCATAQPEDSLQLYIPSFEDMSKVGDYEDCDTPPMPYWPVLHKFTGCLQWPLNSIVLPGNEVIFSLETASDYLKDDRASAYGFKCLVVGYEWPSAMNSTNPVSGLKHLEAELSFLGGMCAASLMKKDLQLPVIGDAVDVDIEVAEAVAAHTLSMHGPLLSKGLALNSPPSVSQALEGMLSYSVQSNERLFLKDFVGCVAGTSGGRLAQWLQPGSRVDPSNCQVLYTRDELRCGWPAVITVLTRDQYSDLVSVSNMRVEVKAIPIDKKELGNCDAGRKIPRMVQPDPLTFGGLPPPPLHTPYEPTIRDKMCFHSICVMKPYQNYSFEELRYACPPVKRSSENMLVRSNNDGSYSATWTPASIGFYSIVVTIDGFEMEEAFKVEVKEPPQGITPPNQSQAKKSIYQPSRLRKFVAQNSAGLRIRAHPSLQSEQIGVVHVNGTIAFIDEIHNDDGVWLRLSADTIKQYCTTGIIEAWCLQYNQHLGKTLLLPVEEPRSILEHVLQNTSLRKPPEIHERHQTPDRKKPVVSYQVIKCGASGHNIRSRPSLKAPPVGMLVLGNKIRVLDYTVNSDGYWVMLDKNSSEKYCFNTDHEAWSLAIGPNNVLYLGTVSGNDKDPGALPQVTMAKPHKKGYDFATNSQDTNFTFSGSTPPVPTTKIELPSTNPFVFGDSVKIDKITKRERKENKLSSLPKWFKPDDGKCDCSPTVGEHGSNGNGITPPGTPKRSQSPKITSRNTSQSSSPVPIATCGNILNESTSSSPQTFGSPRSFVSSMEPELSARSSSNQSDTSAHVSSIPRDLSQSPTHPHECSPTPSESSMQTKSEVGANETSIKNVDTERNSKKLTQTGTQTSPENGVSSSIKGHFSIGSCSNGKEDRIRISRVDRPTGKSRPKRAISPASMQQLPTTSKVNFPNAETVKEAMSPSVAESLRAVFAAFLWHEGIVHDAMACASFLKFHPTLPKQGAIVVTRKQEIPIDKRRQEISKEERARQRHSVEVSNAGNYIYIQPAILESLTKSAANASANRRRNHKISSGSITEDSGEFGYNTISVLPPALKSLVVLWEELGRNCIHAFSNQLVASPIQGRSRKGDKADFIKSDNREKNATMEKDFKKSRKKRIVPRNYLEHIGLTSYLHSTGSDTLCELCGDIFPHPVTFHMHQVHPGCGQHAGGKGYNSGGNYCLGWAGNCGDGGIPNSSWYLLCEECRDKYMRNNKMSKQPTKMKSITRKKSTCSKSLNSPSITPGLEPHIIMKNNAMFLLELASSADSVMNRRRRTSSGMIPVSENNSPPDCSGPFTPTPPFQCLQALGVNATPNEPEFFERILRQQNFHENNFGQRPLSDVSISDNDSDSGKGLRFHRSVSMGTNGIPWAKAGLDGRIIMLRKRNSNSTETANEGGSSLLCSPSSALQKLVPKVDTSPIVRTKMNCSDESLVISLLQRPVMQFLLQQHDLESLHLAMKQALRKAMCRVYAMQALNWLLKSVTQPICLHDLLWWFVTSLTPIDVDNENDDDNRPHKKTEDQDLNVCEHPLSDISIAGDAVHPLPSTFHALLQTIADLMILLPMGSSLQQMAVRCWGLRFSQADHSFLHRSQVFSNISKILSRSEEMEDCTVSMHESHQIVHPSCSVESLKDLTPFVEIKASSRQAMIASLTDGSTETFWESGDEDRNKTKSLTVLCNQNHLPKMICIHIDNCRDLGNKISNVTFYCGPNTDEMTRLRTVEVESRLLGGWAVCPITELNSNVIRLELKGPDNSVRVRQIRVLGNIDGDSLKIPRQHNAVIIQRRNCEAETLRVFRLITSQVFGKLLHGEQKDNSRNSVSLNVSDDLEPLEESNDLREHMVGILFSRSKLTHLQKQVIVHIVQAIRKETERVRDEWESLLASGHQFSNSCEDISKNGDAYCFEMLSMVLALSGSSVGRTYLSHQSGLLNDLLILLHAGSARVQRQVTSLLRRMLSEITPQGFAKVMGITNLPEKDFGIVSATYKSVDSPKTDEIGILDVFLSIIAKALTAQVKIKGKSGLNGGTNKEIATVTLASCIDQNENLGKRWWLRGYVNKKLAEGIVHLIKDMAAGKLSESWANVTKGAIAENIVNLTQLSEEQRDPSVCIKTPLLWLALASLCVLDKDHVERLSSGQWTNPDGQPTPPRPTCSNHDDGETTAVIQCSTCGNLCADCDRFLHLHRKTRNHQRQVCKEEEEAIKVELHEGCGRSKLFWLLALADARTLKALVEYRDGGTQTKGAGMSGVCRFCGTIGNSGLLAIGNVCADHECQEYGRTACTKLLSCGHVCGGILGETNCLPCLHGCSGEANLKQDADDMCMICFTEALSSAPAIQLKCGHVFHLHCCKTVLMKKWAGPRITFSFSLCPICKQDIVHPVLESLLAPIQELYKDVKRKALMRLEYEGLHTVEAIVTPGARFFNDSAGYAMDRYAYYVCYKCNKAYYGGEARCDNEVGENYDPTELVCGGCSDVARAQMCPKHGTDFLEYKCRYCCSVAVFFCFGTTHFCNPCHDDFQRVTNLSKNELPSCPAGPKARQLDGDECPLHVKHPPTGEEFALGCGVCRNAHTF